MQEERAGALVRRPDRARVPRDACRSPATATSTTSASRCSTCCGRTSTTAASPGRSPRGVRQDGRRADGAALGPARRASSAIDTFDGELDEAFAPLERDAPARGRDRRQPRRHAGAPRQPCPASRTRFEATLVWMSEKPLDPQKIVPAQAHHAAGARARSSSIDEHASTSRRLTPEARDTLELNDIGRVARALPPPALLRRLRRRTARTGAFILIDSLTNDTVGRRHDRRGASTGARRERAGPRSAPASARPPGPDGRGGAIGGADPETPRAARSSRARAVRRRPVAAVVAGGAAALAAAGIYAVVATGDGRVFVSTTWPSR